MSDTWFNSGQNINKSIEEVGNGSYTLTASFATVNLTTSGNLEVVLPQAGTWLIYWTVSANVNLTVLGTSGSTTDLRLNGSTTGILAESDALEEIPLQAFAIRRQVTGYWVGTLAAETLRLQAKRTLGAGATLGTGTIVSSSGAAISKIMAVRLR